MDRLNLSCQQLTDNQLDLQLQTRLTDRAYWRVDLKYNKLSKWPDLSAYRQFDRVTHLYVSNNNITDAALLWLPGDIVEVGMGHNKIPALTDLTQHQKLQKLGLSYNNLQYFDGLMLPVSIQYVHAGYNQVKRVGDCSHLSKLAFMDLTANPIAYIHPNNTDFKCWIVSRLAYEFFDTSEGYERLLMGGFSTEYLSTPPSEVFKRGYQSVLSYFRAIAISSSINHSKKR